MKDKVIKRVWSKEDTEGLIEDCKSLSIDQLASKYNRSRRAITNRVKILNKLSISNLSPQYPNYTRYTEDEIKYITDNHKQVSVVKIAKAIGKPTWKVRCKMIAMGLSMIIENRKWTQEELNIIKDNIEKDVQDIADIIDRSRISVTIKIKELGLNPFRNNMTSSSIICTGCKNTFPATNDFFYFKQNGNIRTSRCIPCSRLKVANHNNKNISNYFKSLLRGIKGDVKRRFKGNNESNIDIDYLQDLYVQQNAICNITGISMTFGNYGGRNPSNVSIDRIDSSIGYIKGNIQLICMWANLAKTTLSMHDFKNYIDLAFTHLNKTANAKDINIGRGQEFISSRS